MLKKTTLLALSVAALAVFALPTVASAQLKEGGTNLAVGAEVTATMTNLETDVTAFGVTLGCELVTLHLKVVKNNAGEIELADMGTTIEGCGSAYSNPTSGTLTLGGGTGLATGATFVMSGVCDFAGNIPFSYESGGSTLTVTGTEQLNGNCGIIDKSGDFHLETSDETEVTID